VGGDLLRLCGAAPAFPGGAGGPAGTPPPARDLRGDLCPAGPGQRSPQLSGICTVALRAAGSAPLLRTAGRGSAARDSRPGGRLEEARPARLTWSSTLAPWPPATVPALTLTDICSGWTDLLPVMGKGQRGVLLALDQIRQRPLHACRDPHRQRLGVPQRPPHPLLQDPPHRLRQGAAQLQERQPPR
jgi:hypothetical protein